MPMGMFHPTAVGLATTLAVGYAVSLLRPTVTRQADEWNWFAITRRPLKE